MPPGCSAAGDDELTPCSPAPAAAVDGPETLRETFVAVECVRSGPTWVAPSYTPPPTTVPATTIAAAFTAIPAAPMPPDERLRPSRAKRPG